MYEYCSMPWEEMTATVLHRLSTSRIVRAGLVRQTQVVTGEKNGTMMITRHTNSVKDYK